MRRIIPNMLLPSDISNAFEVGYLQLTHQAEELLA